MAAIGDALASEHPLTNGGWKVRLVPIRELTGGDGFWVVIALFLLSIGLLMAIATANVSNLIMVRTPRRARASWRCAPRWRAKSGRLLRQFLAEGLRAVGDCGALLSRAAGVGGTAARSQSISPKQVFQQLGIDGHELALRGDARAHLPGGVFARLGAADRASRSARSARHARRPRVDGEDARPRRAGGRAGGAGRRSCSPRRAWR